MKIGLMDSGIGGLSVLQLALAYMPEEKFYFYADEAHVPYGEKTKEEIIGFVDGIVSFFLSKQVDAIVIACNTATSAAIAKMREKYNVPIIGMEPAVKKAVDLYGDRRVLVAATPITVRGEKMKCLIEKVDKQHLVDLLPLPKLVHYAEQGDFESASVKKYLIEELGKYQLEDYSSLVLGCTHFNYFKKSFREILPKEVHFVDGNEGTVHRLMDELGIQIGNRSSRRDTHQQVTFYKSGIEVVNQQELNQFENDLCWLDQMLMIE